MHRHWRSDSRSIAEPWVHRAPTTIVDSLPGTTRVDSAQTVLHVAIGHVELVIDHRHLKR